MGGGAAFERGAYFACGLADRDEGVNIATAPKAPKLELAPLTIGVSKRSEATRDLLGISVTLPPGQRVDLVDGDVTVQAEVDATWVRPTNLTPGLTVELLDIRVLKEMKLPDLNAESLQAAINTVNGTARSMGVEVV